MARRCGTPGPAASAIHRSPTSSTAASTFSSPAAAYSTRSPCRSRRRAPAQSKTYASPMSEIDRLVDELERDHAGDPWHGSPVKAILRGVTAAEAASRIVPQAHTIWELVLHMTAWKDEVRR